MIAIDVDVASGERAYHIAYEDTLHVSKGWGKNWRFRHQHGYNDTLLIHIDTLVDWEHLPSSFLSILQSYHINSRVVFWWQDGDEEHLSSSEVRNFVVRVLSERSFELLCR